MSSSIASAIGPSAEGDVVSLPELVYLRLRDAIVSGALKADQALRQEEIAQNLRVSRVPVREALSRLEVEGLVIQRPRRGYIVTSLNLEDIEDIFYIRMMIEERATRLATQRRTSEDVSGVARLVQSMDRLNGKGATDVQLYAERNRAFHLKLYEISGRPQLSRFMLVLRSNVERYIRIGGAIANAMDTAQEEHHRILDAFRRGAAAEAGRLAREHCQHTYDRLAAKLREGT